MDVARARLHVHASHKMTEQQLLTRLRCSCWPLREMSPPAGRLGNRRGSGAGLQSADFLVASE